MDFRNSTQYIDEDHFEVLPNLTPEQQARMNQEHREKLQAFYNKNKRYQIDNWYPAIKQFTFNSFCFQLTVIEGYLLHCLYYEYQLSQEIQAARKNLIVKINDLLLKNKSQANGGKYFMKLSTRSPKDYCWDYRAEEQYNQAVQKLIIYLKQQKITLETSPQKLNNSLYKFFLVNCHQKIMIRSGQDFIRIFSKSQRIIADINDFSFMIGGSFQKIKSGNLDEQGKNKKLVNVWVRDWDYCQWEQQFRSFYNNYQLTAISQYDQRCYFPNLPPAKQHIKQSCLKCFEQVVPKLKDIGLEKGVIDFVVKPNQVKIVEINVFDGDARASLFSWTQDRHLLDNGPLEIRVLDKEIEISKAYLGSIMGMIDKKSTDVIVEALQKSGLSSVWK